MNWYTFISLISIILVLIDTWWNVNEEFTNYLREAGFVLIDTWWNVNFIRKSGNYKNGNVLIDTWWNVNS